MMDQELMNNKNSLDNPISSQSIILTFNVIEKKGNSNNLGQKHRQSQKRIIPEIAYSENLNERPKTSQEYKYRAKNPSKDNKNNNILENDLLHKNREIASELGPARTDTNQESNFEDDVYIII